MLSENGNKNNVQVEKKIFIFCVCVCVCVGGGWCWGVMQVCDAGVWCRCVCVMCVWCVCVCANEVNNTKIQSYTTHILNTSTHKITSLQNLVYHDLLWKLRPKTNMLTNMKYKRHFVRHTFVQYREKNISVSVRKITQRNERK
jgi:hypothetical protein